MSQPGRTINKAAKTLKAGQKVYIKGGTYKERLVPANSGTKGNYIIFAAMPGQKVVLDGKGKSLSNSAGIIHLSNRSFIKIVGLKVQNSSSKGIFVDHSNHITIKNNNTYNTVSSGIAVWYSQYVIIDGNHIKLACNGGGPHMITIRNVNHFQIRKNVVQYTGSGNNGGEGIDILGTSANGKVYKNVVHHARQVGIYLDAYTGHLYNIKVYQNKSFQNTRSGISIAVEAGGSLNNVNIFNNISYRNGTNGITISDCCSGSTHTMSYVKIYNNTVVKNGKNTSGGGISVENAEIQNVIITNNIISNNNKFQMYVEKNVPLSQLTVNRNLLYGYQKLSNEFPGKTPILGNPRFINLSANNFHLQATSPAIDKASSIVFLAIDYDFRKRPIDGNLDNIARSDVGAYEFKPK